MIKRKKVKKNIKMTMIIKKRRKVVEVEKEAGAGEEAEIEVKIGVEIEVGKDSQEDKVVVAVGLTVGQNIRKDINRINFTIKFKIIKNLIILFYKY